MAVNIESRRLPVMREIHAVRLLSGGRAVDSGAIRTIFTGLIALGILALVGLGYYQTGTVDAAFAFAMGAVITFYFTDPKQPAYGAPAKREGRDGNP